jgi:hypothetical protein
MHITGTFGMCGILDAAAVTTTITTMMMTTTVTTPITMLAMMRARAVLAWLWADAMSPLSAAEFA